MIETRLIFVFLLLPNEWLELKKIKCIFARFYPSRKNQVIGEALKIRRVIKASLGAIVGVVLVACSPTRHVPDGSYLLDHVKIETDDKSVKPSDLNPICVKSLITVCSGCSALRSGYIICRETIRPNGITVG